MICTIRVAKSNCHTLILSFGTSGNAPTTSIPLSTPDICERWRFFLADFGVFFYFFAPLPVRLEFGQDAARGFLRRRSVLLPGGGRRLNLQARALVRDVRAAQALLRWACHTAGFRLEGMLFLKITLGIGKRKTGEVLWKWPFPQYFTRLPFTDS